MRPTQEQRADLRRRYPTPHLIITANEPSAVTFTVDDGRTPFTTSRQTLAKHILLWACAQRPVIITPIPTVPGDIKADRIGGSSIGDKRHGT